MMFSDNRGMKISFSFVQPLSEVGVSLVTCKIPQGPNVITSLCPPSYIGKEQSEILQHLTADS